MEEIVQNKMAVEPLKKLFWKMGLPMIVSMVLQALYNVVDSIFVANMQGTGALANEALTYAFPIQILIIAIGVGTGVGLNALLSKSLGERDKEKVNKIAGNGIFLALVIYTVFLVFGLVASNWFISFFTNIPEVIAMGASYLQICSSLSLGAIGFAIYERFLQALRYAFKPFFTALLRLAIFVFPIAYLFTLSASVINLVWWTFPISEFLTAVVSFFILKDVIKKKIETIWFLKNGTSKVTQLLGRKDVKITITVYNSVNSEYVREATDRLNTKIQEHEQERET